jgi:hypothetical protein
MPGVGPQYAKIAADAASKGLRRLRINNRGELMRWVLLMALLCPLSSQAGSIYLCKSYSGSTFWSKAHCREHNALIDWIVSVPDSLPWDQQVQLAEQDRARRAAAANPQRNVVVQPSWPDPAASRQAECASLDAQITQWDAMARQPQSGQMQDWITAQKRKARDRQFQLKC